MDLLQDQDQDQDLLIIIHCIILLILTVTEFRFILLVRSLFIYWTIKTVDLTTGKDCTNRYNQITEEND